MLFFFQIEDGDIICFQKPTPVESEEECKYPDVPSFLEYVHNRQVPTAEYCYFIASVTYTDLFNVIPTYIEWVDTFQIVHFRSLEKPKEDDFSLEL